MALSIFENKGKHPTDDELVEKLGPTYHWWKGTIDHLYQHYPNISEEWNFGGEKYGWSLRVLSKKRRLIYLIPCEGYFKFAFVFGQKALEAIISSHIHEEIKHELKIAKTYAEGTGFRMDLKDEKFFEDIKNLIAIKFNN
jgi:hypothetical protein